MNRFYVGQRIRCTGAAHPAPARIDGTLVKTGALGYVRQPLGHWVIPADNYIVEYDDQKSTHIMGVYMAHARQIEPVFEGDQFERFMESVLKPVPLPKEITA